MIHLNDLTLEDIGRWVVYRSRHYATREAAALPAAREHAAHEEAGRIKRIGHKLIWVVFHCGDDWDRYDQYTAAACDPWDLEFKE